MGNLSLSMNGNTFKDDHVADATFSTGTAKRELAKEYKDRDNDHAAEDKEAGYRDRDNDHHNPRSGHGDNEKDEEVRYECEDNGNIKENEESSKKHPGQMNIHHSKVEHDVTFSEMLVRIQCMMIMNNVLTFCCSTHSLICMYLVRFSCTTITTQHFKADEKNHPICNRMATQC